MSAADLPRIALKIAFALLKQQVTNLVGDEALKIAADELVNLGDEKVSARLDAILGSREGVARLLEAAQRADECFRAECVDQDLRGALSIPFGDLPSVQQAIADLPSSLDETALSASLGQILHRDFPALSPEQIEVGVDLYADCLRRALLPIKDYTLGIIGGAVLRTEKKLDKLTLEQHDAFRRIEGLLRSFTPTASKPKFLVPFPHNPDFVGRGEDLATLHSMVQQGIVGIKPTVLVGLGGIGKTQLAVEYAHAHRDDYPGGVFWLNAVNLLLLEFAGLAEQLGLADKETPRDEAARRAWGYLDDRPDSLVIFDNVVEPAELNIPIAPGLMPANLRCRTLFTTRQRDFPRNFQPFEVKVLPEMAAMHLLLRPRPEVLEEHHPEWGIARIVCASLGWLPLALELAAAYLGEYPEVTLNGYLERLRTEGKLRTVDDTELRPEELPTRHEVAVAATLQTQWSRLDDEDARLLFRAAGQFPEATWIPIARLGLLTGVKAEADPGRAAPLTRALKKLNTVSLIEELTGERLRLHPLVQEFAARLSPVTFRAEMAGRVADAFRELQNLEAHVIQRGVYEVLEDLRTGLGLCLDDSEDNQIYAQLYQLERILGREAHHLRHWKPEPQPYFFLQQFCNSCLELNLADWQTRAEALLAERKWSYLREGFQTSREPEALIRTLEGHTSDVNGVSVTPDGRLAVSASWDNTLKVWDLHSGQLVRTLEGHTIRVNGVAVTPDGRFAVSASWDNTLKVWDLHSGQLVRTLEGHTSDVYGVAVTTDGRLAVSASLDNTLKVWDLQHSGQLVRTLEGHTSGVFGVAVTTDGRFAVSASLDNTLKVWDLHSGQVALELVTDVQLRCCAIVRDGRMIVAGDEMGIVHFVVWVRWD